ncbi:TetR/AcrR family transcriptional regulator [Paenibacillus sepulcri]|uniref:TetR/AcrR family transcriptional regulator n=1 Tax=Paenibacillus sepulcri TaxID=359917 RepID=A0ABS7C3M9_9BACL|nr:TetR/AcrR family transcriptional regulator [Paenibacillus sepulcri]
MAPLNEEQLIHIRDERTEQIMAAALQVFARRGIIGTKMSMIAAEAGISHGLLYHYFKSKDELFTTLVQRAVTESISALKNVYQLPGSPIDKLRSLTESMIEAEGAPFFMLVHQARTSDGVPEESRQLLKEYPMNAYVDILLPLLKEGQEAGEIAPGRPEDLIADYLSVLSGLMVLDAKQTEDYRMPEVDRLLRILT